VQANYVSDVNYANEFHIRNLIEKSRCFIVSYIYISYIQDICMHVYIHICIYTCIYIDIFLWFKIQINQSYI